MILNSTKINTIILNTYIAFHLSIFVNTIIRQSTTYKTAINGTTTSETFEILEENLAADRRNIYFKQTKLTDIDRKTFIFLGTKCIDKHTCAEKVSFFKDKNGEYNTSEME